MKLTLSRIILPVAAVVVALGLISCGGNNTASPTLQGNPAPITLVISPQDSSVAPDLTDQFTATVTGTSNHTVTWTLTNSELKHSSTGKKSSTVTHDWGIPASISSTGLFSAGTSSGDYTITATLNADPSITASTPMTVSGDPAFINVSPNDDTIDEGLTQQFTAEIVGGPQGPVTWSVIQGGGSIDANGLYTSGFSATTATIQAKLISAPLCTGTATINVNGQEDIVHRGQPGKATSKLMLQAKPKSQ